MTAYPPPSSPQQPAAYPPPPPSTYPPVQQGGYPPPPNPAGAYPPPPPVTQRPPAKAPAVAWLVPVAALVAVVGAFTPWFNPTATEHGVNVLKDGGALYSWKDGRIGLAAPILLVILSITVVSLLRGKVRGRFVSGHDPVRSVAKWTIGIGVVAVVTVVIAFFLVPGQYHFNAGSQVLSWNDLKNHGLAMSRGPQLGFYLTIVAGALAVIAGIAMLVSAKDQRVGPSPAK